MGHPSKLARTNIDKSFEIKLQITERIFCQNAYYENLSFILKIKPKISLDKKIKNKYPQSQDRDSK